MNRQDLTKKLIKKASQNITFKDRLINDTKAVIETEMGIKIPDGVKINVLEEKNDEYYLVLPNQQPPDAAELTDAELNNVTGGYGGDGNEEPPHTMSSRLTCMRP